jgi:hypothetical protein
MSFKLPDPYAGMKKSEIKQRCRKLCRAIMHKDTMIALMVEGGIDALPKEWREEAARIHSAYVSE